VSSAFRRSTLGAGERQEVRMSTSNNPHGFHHIALAALLLLALAPACEDTGEPTGDTTQGAGGSGAAGGTGGTTGTAGSGGEGGGGGGGSGGCLPESSYAALFTLGASDLCAVAVYEAATTIAYQQPSWGEHGGPLLVVAGPGSGEVTLSRWSPPGSAEGAMSVATKTVDAQIPDGAFAGAQAIDIGFRPGTLISYVGAFPDTAGELVVATDAGTDERYPMNGLFSIAVVPGAEATSGRVVHTGLSPLGNEDAGANGLHAADDCDGDLVPNGGATCAEPLQIDAWGDASGPVVTDSAGNVIALMSNFAGDQEARFFAAEVIAEGGGASAGAPLFTADGFGLSLAAMGPADALEGIAAFQPSDSATFQALDVLQVRYSTSSGSLVAGEPAPLLTLKTPGAPVALLTDPEGRLWAGVSILDEQGAPVSTTFVVLARKPE
jgi:hypothetical protein